MKQIFHLILTLAVMLTMAQTAWAADPVTKTISFSTAERSSDQLSIIATDPDDNTTKSVITADGNTNDIGITSTLKISNKTSASSEGSEVSLFISPYVNGKVTKIEFTSVMRAARFDYRTFSMSIDGMKYNGTDATLTGNISGYESVTFISNSTEGIAGNLTMRLGVDAVFQINKSSCQMIITYIPSAAPTHSHNFSFNAVGNTLTATCGHSDGLDCSLADANYQATLTLAPPVDTYYRPNSTYSAHHNLSGFNTLTGLNATATDITYVNNTTGSNLGSTAPTTAGNYTASVTATVGGTNYSLTTDFKVNTENSINNNIRQISLNKTNAANDEEITITFTPRSHELVNTLTVTGATTNKSIGNGITKVDEYTYTFMMPFEEVTIGATFKSSNASLYKYAITTDITGSGAVDYNAEEYLGAGDAITITFMPYLQGNLEAGSVVLEGLTVTGATTNMSVGNGITDNGDNTYTFTMPGENVTVTAKAYLSADAILAGTINEPIYIKQGNGIQIGCNNIWTYVNDGALPLVIPDGNTLRLAGGTDVRLDLADKNAIACEGDAIVELIPNEVSNEIWIGDRPERNSGKATIKVGPAGKTLTIRVADESTETVHLSVKSISQYDRNCDVIGCDEDGSCGSIVVESGQVESRVYFNHSGRAFRTTDGTITFGYKYPDDKIIFDGGSEGTVKIEDGKQFHSYTDNNTKYSGTINLQGINSFYARPDKYTVTFDENGGSAVDNQTVAHGMKATEPATTREGFTFRGWKKGDDVYDFNTVVTSDLTLTAEWLQSITDEYIKVTIPSKEYTGSAQTPEITVKAGETTLTLDTDYTVTAPSGDCVNAGDYIFTITGAGEYKGSRTEKFTITKATIGLSWNTSTYDYDGTEKTVTATATGLVESDACNVTLTGNTATAVGKYTATATDLDNTNYQLPESGLTCDYEIVRKMENLFYDDCLWAGYVAQENLALPSGVEAYAITALGDATATATELGYIPEDVPVLLKRTDKTQNLYRASAGTGSAPATNLLQKASDSNQPTAFRDYVLYKDQFILIDGGTLADGKVFLPIPANNKSRAATRSIAIEGEDTTGIDAIDNGQWTIDNWYSLDGRKLGDKPTKKGIYIHNGQKVIIK